MSGLALKLYSDESGFIVSAELVLIATVLVLGLISGLSELSLNLNNELEGLGSAFGGLSQSYEILNLDGHAGGTGGQSFIDIDLFCSSQGDIVGNLPLITP